MKEKLGKKEFIKNFEYFKRNPEKYDKKRNSKYFKVTMFLIAPLIVMMTGLVLPLFLIPHWYIPNGYLCCCFGSIDYNYYGYL